MKTLAILPTYDGTRYNAAAVASLAVRGAALLEPKTSRLARGLNTAWARMLNLRPKVDHVLILHADVVPRDPDWFEVLCREMEKHAAPVMSVAIPIKDGSGLTSTAFDTDPWRPQRVTCEEFGRRPATWTDPALLVNTGCLLIDVREPWVESITWTINDTVRRINGEWVADVEPEDWNFSRQCRTLHVERWVTSAVAVAHVGPHGWTL